MLKYPDKSIRLKTKMEPQDSPQEILEQLEETIAKKDAEIAILKAAAKQIAKFQEGKSVKLDEKTLSNLDDQLKAT